MYLQNTVRFSIKKKQKQTQNQKIGIVLYYIVFN